VYRRALGQFTVEEITEGFAAARGLALPSQLRRMLKAQGRDLHAEFIRLLPSPPQPVSIQRWTLRRVGLLAGTALLAFLLVGMLVSTTNNDSAVKTSLEIQSLGCTDLEPLWLQAQAVPSASLVPCVRPLPVGWSVTNVAVNDGRSVITLGHDRTGGDAMTARLTAGCDVGQAAEQASGQPRGPALPAGRAPGARLQRRALRRVPRRLRDHPDSGTGVQQGRGHGRGSRDPRLHPPPAARPGPRAALRRPAPARFLDDRRGPGRACAALGRNPTIHAVRGR
jgi:hypothetical protein